MIKHEWYVIGSYESDIKTKHGWADLELECIDDHDCGKKASVMIDIEPNKIRETEPDE